MSFDRDWMDDVPCREQPSLFFSYSVVDQDAAVGICRNECPEIDACRAWALQHGDIDRSGQAIHGVIAGVRPSLVVRRPTKTLRCCELGSCKRLYMGRARQRYCSTECSDAARVERRSDRRRSAS